MELVEEGAGASRRPLPFFRRPFAKAREGGNDDAFSPAFHWPFQAICVFCFPRTFDQVSDKAADKVDLLHMHYEVTDA